MWTYFHERINSVDVFSRTSKKCNLDCRISHDIKMQYTQDINMNGSFHVECVVMLRLRDVSEGRRSATSCCEAVTES